MEPRQWRIVLANIGITVFGLLFVGFTLQGPVPAGALFWLVFAAGGAGVASWVLVRWIGPWRRTTSRIATVDRELVVVHRDPEGRSDDRFLPWDDLDGMGCVPVIQLSAPPAPALWLVRHHHEHPADRAELGTERALDRIQRG